MRELEWVLVAEQIGSNEGARRRQRRAPVDAGERGSERQLSAITEDHGGAQ